MEIQDGLPVEQSQNPKKIMAGPQEENFQYNRQDMDQEQNVNLNPVLTNTQNIHFHLIGDELAYCGKISGTAFSESNRKAAANATVHLFFGNDKLQPIYRTCCDLFGNFLIEDLPPGYYTLTVEYGAGHSHRTQYIKVLPGQTVVQNILLKDCYVSRHY